VIDGCSFGVLLPMPDGRLLHDNSALGFSVFKKATGGFAYQSVFVVLLLVEKNSF